MSRQAIRYVFHRLQIKLLKRAKALYHHHISLQLRQKPTKREAWTASSACSVTLPMQMQLSYSNIHYLHNTLTDGLIDGRYDFSTLGPEEHLQ